MPRFLRTIRQGRWLKYPSIDWLQDGELQGDALSDLATEGGKLSVYRVSDENDLKRVVTALAANRGFLGNVDYAVFEDTDFVDLGIEANLESGKTPDMEVNQLHYDLCNLTVKRLADLAEIVSAGERKRVQRKEVLGWLQVAYAQGHFDETKIEPRILEALK